MARSAESVMPSHEVDGVSANNDRLGMLVPDNRRQMTNAGNDAQQMWNQHRSSFKISEEGNVMLSHEVDGRSANYGRRGMLVPDNRRKMTDNGRGPTIAHRSSY